MSLNKLLNKLHSRKQTDFVFNQYRNSKILSNLEYYIELCKRKKIKILLVGEAPGYAGCALTGIPFTSNRVFRRKNIPFFESIVDNLYISDDTTERSATIVWNALNDLNFVPAFWNSFPFHPYKQKNLKSNRAPSPEEVLEGKEYLELVIDYLKPNTVAGLGWHGHNTLKELLPNRDLKYIRHPSYGGKPEFIKGMKKFINI